MQLTSLRFALAASLLSSAAAGCMTGPAQPAGTVRVRVAHVSPDAPPVDFCVASHGTGAFTGPVLASLGHLTGIGYGNVTSYLDLPADQYDVRLVAPGATDCATPLGNLRDFDDLPALTNGVSATIAAEGLVDLTAAEPFTLRAYVDDTTVGLGKAKLRFVHASPGTPAVDVGLGGGALFTSVFTDVSFGGIAPGGGGYIETSPLDGVEISARAHGDQTDALSIKPAALPAGAIATAFAIGEIGDDAAPLRVLLCVDNAPANGLLSACSVVGGAPERARVRIAHLSPDTPAVDVCLAPAGTGAFGQPILKTLGALGGLTYPQVTNYVELPTGTYDVRVIHATATGCGTGSIPDTEGVKLANGHVVTVAAIGELDPSGPAASDPGLRLALFGDATTVTAGNAKLRFIHASPGTPAVDVGLGSGHGFVKVFANVSFGTIATNSGIDGFGFVETGAFTSAVSARVAGAASDALVIPSVSLPADTIATAFAIGNKTGQSANPLAVLLCADNAATSGLLAACTVAQ